LGSLCNRVNAGSETISPVEIQNLGLSAVELADFVLPAVRLVLNAKPSGISLSALRFYRLASQKKLKPTHFGDRSKAGFGVF
jgi:hypothetical protein